MNGSDSAECNEHTKVHKRKPKIVISVLGREKKNEETIKIISIGMLFSVLPSDRVSITTVMTLRIIRYYVWTAEEISAKKMKKEKIWRFLETDKIVIMKGFRIQTVYYVGKVQNKTHSQRNNQILWHNDDKCEMIMATPPTEQL